MINPGQVKATVGNVFCEYCQLIVFKGVFICTVVVPRKSNYFYLGRDEREIYRGKERYLSRILKNKKEELNEVVVGAEELCRKTYRYEMEWLVPVSMKSNDM